jgi:hypothetical protein
LQALLLLLLPPLPDPLPASLLLPAQLCYQRQQHLPALLLRLPWLL